MKPVIIYSTTSSREEAQKIGSYLVGNKLAACVNIIPNIESIYEWENKICRESEFLLMIKTDAKFKDDIEKVIDELHSYDIPEMIIVSIEDGSSKYMNWMNQNLRKNINE
ncbi:MAG: divalent-cation tolerance protein CutA [Candidatus Marinimicrobia bacterium]|jgi:periplasmic divalent cation tolerance protein|nr:divalent-cation tolerance protein CutA [Candidatus Neomarinimicrobiota bacterium]MBT3675816.1 divalent-cation tolerance protein CutA [Candidatus Neomarinimicrobiota bacterium]MBT3762978.1 divalent-cation tolerance protein CutA [Candidatus Neomarinimicrobiota bacterium]MBT4069125.1 divalent-cation tolerance protein CutA [Candidatus Neomarinimicrobiota bacterium]MBT4271511.1 divalent-cation tolerance protein CutA [Candidatus Neomarinimicrobiota bacterium]